jgi:hypothetical protein
MKVGENPSISADFSNNASSMTLDEQIIAELSVPVQKGDYKAANARRDKVKEIFDNLPPDQAKELYQRLENYNWKDNLNDKFHGTFEDYSLNILKKSLKDRFEPQNGGTTGTTGAPQTGNASGAEKKSDVGNVGKTRADKLDEQLLAKDPNAPMKIAARKDMNEFEKQNAIGQWMRNATPDDFQKMIDQSGKFPKDVQKLLNESIENSPNGNAQQRILKDLKPDQQVEMIKRLSAGGFQNSVGTILGQSDPAVLNQVAKDMKSIPGFTIDADKNKGTGSLTHMLAMRAKDLTPDNQRALADTILNDGKPQLQNPAWRAFLTEEMFDSLKGQATEQQARDLFAHIQQNGGLKDMLSNFKDEPINFQKQFLGLGKKELQAVKQTFEQLANEAPQGSHLQEIYRASAHSAAEWSS